MKEAKEGAIEVMDYSYQTFWDILRVKKEKRKRIELNSQLALRTLQYLYSGVADINANNCLEMLMASNQYRIFSLKQMCQTFIAASLEVDTVAAILPIVERVQSRGVVNACYDFIVKNYSQVTETPSWQDLPQEFKDKVVSMLRARNTGFPPYLSFSFFRSLMPLVFNSQSIETEHR
jgi:hypothetical protein